MDRFTNEVPRNEEQHKGTKLVHIDSTSFICCRTAGEAIEGVYILETRGDPRSEWRERQTIGNDEDDIFAHIERVVSQSEDYWEQTEQKSKMKDINTERWSVKSRLS